MKRILMMCFMLVIAFTMVGCSKKNNLYNAKIINNNYEFNDEFIMNNKTFGAHLNDGSYIDDNYYPKERMIIINNEIDLNNIFKKFEDIDFTKEMIVMHAFTTASNSEYELQNIKVNEEQLAIEYKTKKTSGINSPNASNPDTKWLIVKLDLINIDSVKFVFLA